jgi:hypothetical protein
MRTIRMIMTIIGWFAATGALVAVMFRLEFHLNFFNWSPEWDVEATLYGIGILTILACIWLLAKWTRDRVSQVVSILMCLTLAGVAVVRCVIHFCPSIARRLTVARLTSCQHGRA